MVATNYHIKIEKLHRKTKIPWHLQQNWAKYKQIRANHQESQDFCVIRPSLCGLKEDNAGRGEGSFDRPQNSQLLFKIANWKVWWTNSRTTAETEEVLLSSVMSECKGPAVKTERVPRWEESASGRITCCMSKILNFGNKNAKQY